MSVDFSAFERSKAGPIRGAKSKRENLLLLLFSLFVISPVLFIFLIPWFLAYYFSFNVMNYSPYQVFVMLTWVVLGLTTFFIYSNKISDKDKVLLLLSDFYKHFNEFFADKTNENLRKTKADAKKLIRLFSLCYYDQVDFQFQKNSNDVFQKLYVLFKKGILPKLNYDLSELDHNKFNGILINVFHKIQNESFDELGNDLKIKIEQHVKPTLNVLILFKRWRDYPIIRSIFIGVVFFIFIAIIDIAVSWIWQKTMLTPYDHLQGFGAIVAFFGVLIAIIAYFRKK